MKHLILIFWLLFTLSGCSDDDNDIEYRDELLGTWKLVEEFGSSGGPGQWHKVKNGYTYTFDGSGNLITDRYSCKGTYQETVDEVTIEFDCPDSKYRVTAAVSFNNNHLILTPDPGVYCDEGCATKFKRIK